MLTARAIAEIEARDKMIRELREALAQHKMWLGDALDREAVLLSRIARATPGPVAASASPTHSTLTILHDEPPVVAPATAGPRP